MPAVADTVSRLSLRSQCGGDALSISDRSHRARRSLIDSRLFRKITRALAFLHSNGRKNPKSVSAPKVVRFQWNRYSFSIHSMLSQLTKKKKKKNGGKGDEETNGYVTACPILFYESMDTISSARFIQFSYITRLHAKPQQRSAPIAARRKSLTRISLARKYQLCGTSVCSIAEHALFPFPLPPVEINFYQ